MNGSNLHNILTERVRIEQAIASSDDQGGQTLAWELLTECYANIEPQGDQRKAGTRRQQQSAVRYRIKIRPNPSVTRDMRVVWKTRVFSIHHTLFYPLHTVLVCEEEIAL